MSDSTANAREPSMEDILASIRRIIDEEDTRDGTASPALANDSSETGEVPVMAAATVREAVPSFDDVENVGRSDNEEAASDDADDAIFPERESLFWSRATGRSDANASDDEGDDFSAASEHDNAIDDIAAIADGESLTGGTDRDDTQTNDIFARAKTKLDAGRLSARERMQSLAARAENRIEEDTPNLDDALDLPDLSELDDATSVDDLLASAPQIDSREAEQEIYELTEALDFEDAKGDVEEALGFDDLSEESARSETSEDDHDSYHAAFSDAFDTDQDEVEQTTDADSASEVDTILSSGEARAFEEDAQDDVYDLTMPFAQNDTSDDTPDASADNDRSVSAMMGAGVAGLAGAAFAGGRRDESQESPNTESDDTVTAARVTAENTASADIEAVVRPSEVVDYGDPVAEVEDAVEDQVNLAASELEQVAPAFAAEEEHAEAASIDAPSEQPEPEAVEQQEKSVDFSVDTLSPEERDSLNVADISEASEPEVDVPEESAPAAEATETYAPELDTPELDTPDSVAEEETQSTEAMGFTDAFGASDVYHDDPPEMDGDYSATLDEPQEQVAPAAFADVEEAALSDQADDMETVGGLVRDAMEREPVNYADPAALVSMTSEEISARALASLADVEGEATNRLYGSLSIKENGESDSLEGMVRGMLKPMLREWLDDNLPNMVESAVRGEVERISAKSRKYSRHSDE